MGENRPSRHWRHLQHLSYHYPYHCISSSLNTQVHIHIHRNASTVTCTSVYGVHTQVHAGVRTQTHTHTRTEIYTQSHTQACAYALHSMSRCRIVTLVMPEGRFKAAIQALLQWHLFTSSLPSSSSILLLESYLDGLHHATLVKVELR